MSGDAFLEKIQERVGERYDQADRVRSFSQFLDDFLASPKRHLRSAPQYILDMMTSFGTREAARVGQEAVRFQVFDRDFYSGEPMLAGQERVQEEIYNHIGAAAKQGKAEKMLLLHGPNGSGKTTIVQCLIAGLEHYSKTPQGALLKFNWIFTESENLDHIGFEGPEKQTREALDTYAFLEEKDISAKILCELRDPPLFLIPKELRREIIEKAVENCPEEERPRFPYDYFLEGDLCQKCKRIFETLLLANQGNWKKVVRHVQIERFFFSKRCSFIEFSLIRKTAQSSVKASEASHRSRMAVSQGLFKTIFHGALMFGSKPGH